MKTIPFLFAAAITLATPNWVQAQGIWHCSTQTAISEHGVSPANNPQREEVFQIAALSADLNVIGITLRDLIDVYSGIPVRISGRPLTACFLNDNSSTSRDMLEGLGLNTNAMAALARKSAIVKSHLVWVSNETDMLRCMTKNTPAVGYFNELQETPEIAPCF